MLVNVYCLNIYFSDISLWDVLFDKKFVLDKQFINTMVYFRDGSTVNVAHMWRKTGIFKENFVNSLRLCTLNQFPTLLSMETNAMNKSNIPISLQTYVSYSEIPSYISTMVFLKG